MAINNSVDIYNSTFNKDKPTVDEIIAAVKVELETNIENETQQFAFHLVPFIGEMEILQQNRIVDRVICILRDAGIRCSLRRNDIGDSDTQNGDYFFPYFNYASQAYDYLHITWFSRKSQEYMKTYV